MLETQLDSHSFVRSAPAHELHETYAMSTLLGQEPSPHIVHSFSSLQQRVSGGRLRYIDPTFESNISSAYASTFDHQDDPDSTRKIALDEDQSQVGAGTFWGGLVLGVPTVPGTGGEPLGYFQYVEANWTVPHAAPTLFAPYSKSKARNTSDEACSTWIGLSDVQTAWTKAQSTPRRYAGPQAGYNASCRRPGSNTSVQPYTAWFQFGQAGNVRISSFPVSAGDLVGVQITALTTTLPSSTVFAFWNWTRSAYAAFIFYNRLYPIYGHTATWIVERLSNGAIPLARFGSVYFDDATALWSSGRQTRIVDPTHLNGQFHASQFFLPKSNPEYRQQTAVTGIVSGGSIAYSKSNPLVRLTTCDTRNGLIHCEYVCDDAAY
jgi:Peptidase A4 family